MFVLSVANLLMHIMRMLVFGAGFKACATRFVLTVVHVLSDRCRRELTCNDTKGDWCGSYQMMTVQLA